MRTARATAIATCNGVGAKVRAENLKVAELKLETPKNLISP